MGNQDYLSMADQTDNTLQTDVAELKTTMKYVQKDVADTRTDIKELSGEVIAARIDSERRIMEMISRNFAENKESIKSVDDRLKVVEKKTTNSPLVEKIVFGLVAIVLLSFATAVVGLVIVVKGTGH